MNPIMKMLAVPATVVALWAVSAQASTINEDIAKRLEPVGQVCVQGQECKGMAVAATAGGGGGAKTPDEVIAKHCNACHGTGLLNSPKIGDTAAWKERADHVSTVIASIAGASDEEKGKKGVAGLAAVATHGFNAMPPKGTCADCTPEELQGAIEKMSGLK